MLGILVEILDFSFEILGISKICDYRIPYSFFENPMNIFHISILNTVRVIAECHYVNLLIFLSLS